MPPQRRMNRVDDAVLSDGLANRDPERGERKIDRVGSVGVVEKEMESGEWGQRVLSELGKSQDSVRRG